jgi:hypothetical protein
MVFFNIRSLIILSLLTAFSSMSNARAPIDCRPDETNNCVSTQEPWEPRRPVATATPKVYATGFDNDNIGLSPTSPWRKIAKVWINGQVSGLTDGTYKAEGNSIFVDNVNQVYVAGSERGGNPIPNTLDTYPIAKVWVGSNSTALTDGTAIGVARSVHVVGIHNYVAGSDGNVGKIWVDGNLLYSHPDAALTSIFVVGSDIYYCGNIFLPALGVYGYRAAVWKNGSLVMQLPLTNNLRTTAESIFVKTVGSSTTIYVAGTSTDSIYVTKATLWTNGVPTDLTPAGVQSNGTTAAAASSVFVQNSNVYVAGFSHEGFIKRAKLWVNGVGKTLSSGQNQAFATSVFVDNSANVYVGGVEQNTSYSNVPNVGVIWKNGAVNYSTTPSYEHGIYSVFVK